MEQVLEFIPDDIYGERLLISTRADKRELSSNIRAARAILHSFPDVYIIINTHTIELGHKNPEYTINSRLGDRKGIMSEKGITAEIMLTLFPGRDAGICSGRKARL